MASIRDIQTRLARADAELELLRPKLEALRFEMSRLEREKAALEKELARTRNRLSRAERFVAAQTVYLADVLEPGKV